MQDLKLYTDYLIDQALSSPLDLLKYLASGGYCNDAGKLEDSIEFKIIEKKLNSKNSWMSLI